MELNTLHGGTPLRGCRDLAEVLDHLHGDPARNLVVVWSLSGKAAADAVAWLRDNVSRHCGGRWRRVILECCENVRGAAELSRLLVRHAQADALLVLDKIHVLDMDVAEVEEIIGRLVRGGRPLNVVGIGTPTKPVVFDDVAKGVFDAVNGFRAEGGLPPLTWSVGLAEVACTHALEMADTLVMTHRGRNGDLPSDRVTRKYGASVPVRENVAEGSLTPARIVSAWDASPKHHQNMLAPDMARAGVACVARWIWDSAVADDGACRGFTCLLMASDQLPDLHSSGWHVQHH